MYRRYSVKQLEDLISEMKKDRVKELNVKITKNSIETLVLTESVDNNPPSILDRP